MSGSIEEFDDDTDFALPVAPAAPAKQDAQIAQMQNMMSRMQAGEGSGMMRAPRASSMDTELSAEAKKWITVYPIYFDGKRKYMKGCRRVAYENSCFWPKSEHIQDAVARLTLMHAHEPQKTHPQDWENPGRVKVQLFGTDGRPRNKKIESKKALLNAIATLIQIPCGGKPPALKKKSVKPNQATIIDGQSKMDAIPAINNKNASSKSTYKAKKTTTRLRPESRIKGSKPPPLSMRYPMHSPAREAGMLNADLGGMMGGLQQMGPLGAMMGQMGMGADDDADEEEEKKKEEEEKEKLKKKDPMQQLSRRQRKRVVRIGR